MARAYSVPASLPEILLLQFFGTALYRVHGKSNQMWFPLYLIVDRIQTPCAGAPVNIFFEVIVALLKKIVAADSFTSRKVHLLVKVYI